MRTLERRRREEAPARQVGSFVRYRAIGASGALVTLPIIDPYGTVALHAEVSPDSKPSANSGPHSRKT